MIITTITIIGFTILFIFLCFLIISGFYVTVKETSQTTGSDVFLNFDLKGTKPSCLKTNMKCFVDSDCAKTCKEENIDFVCQDLPKPPNNPIGISQKVCKPKVPQDVNCNPETGGVWVWTGEEASETQQWTCVCSYPSYYGNSYEGCNTLNPGVCSNGTFTYNAYTKKAPPSESDCVCNSGFVKLNMGDLNQNTPICVPENLKTFYEYQTYSS